MVKNSQKWSHKKIGGLSGLDVWPERPKGAKDEVKGPKGPLAGPKLLVINKNTNKSSVS